MKETTERRYKDINVDITGYPFVSHVDQAARPVIKAERARELLEQIYRRGVYHSDQGNMMWGAGIKSMGYRYNFRPYLNRYVYHQFGHWQEAFAPNKAMLRGILHGKVSHIIFVD